MSTNTRHPRLKLPVPPKGYEWRVHRGTRQGGSGLIITSIPVASIILLEPKAVSNLEFNDNYGYYRVEIERGGLTAVELRNKIEAAAVKLLAEKRPEIQERDAINALFGTYTAEDCA